MVNGDRNAFVQAVSALAATFRIHADEAVFEGYWIGLDDLPLSSVNGAIRRAMRECKFMPSVFELRKLTGEMPLESRAVQAFDALSRAITRHGGYASVDFDDPVINATVHHLGGWERLCSMPCEEFDKWLRKEFERAYLAFARSGVSSEQARPLIGLVDASKALHGQETAEPRRIATGLPALPGMPARVIGAPTSRVSGLLSNVGKMPEAE